MTRKQIFGISGKFLVEPWESPTLQRHLLSLAEKPEPRICFLATATGDNPRNIEEFYRAMLKHPCRVSHLNLFAPHTVDYPAFLLSQDIIYVGGGATRNLMALWREWGLDHVMRDAWEAGIILSGTSAGSICWFDQCITDSLPEKLLPQTCLGLLRGSACTHYDARPDRPTVFRQLIADGTLASPGVATEDSTALHYVDAELAEVVSADPQKRAYRISRTERGYEEIPIEPRILD